MSDTYRFDTHVLGQEDLKYLSITYEDYTSMSDRVMLSFAFFVHGKLQCMIPELDETVGGAGGGVEAVDGGG